jgi:hypothetical protein
MRLIYAILSHTPARIRPGERPDYHENVIEGEEGEAAVLANRLIEILQAEGHRIDAITPYTPESLAADRQRRRGLFVR